MTQFLVGPLLYVSSQAGGWEIAQHTSMDAYSRGQTVAGCPAAPGPNSAMVRAKYLTACLGTLVRANVFVASIASAQILAHPDFPL